MDWGDEIPGYASAVAHERLNRNAAFLGLADRVCGIDVSPMTLRHYVCLESIGSPYVCGGDITSEDTLAAVWLISPDYDPKNNSARKAFCKRISTYKVADAMREMNDYVSSAFEDAPASAGGNTVQYYSTAASLVDLFAREYGWQLNEILDLPLAVLFQLVKAIIARTDPDAILFNPSDKVRGQWLCKVNNEHR